VSLHSLQDPKEGRYKEPLPIAWIDDLLDQLKGAKYFSKLDLASSYRQVHIEPNDIYKTSFKTKFGLVTTQSSTKRKAFTRH
jgi:hypothetical protein